MKNNFTLTYVKYCVAIEKDKITDELRTNFCNLLKEEPEDERKRLISLIITAIYRHYAKTNNFELAKEECLKLNLGPLVPDSSIFPLYLDFFALNSSNDLTEHFTKMKELIKIVKIRNENLDSFNKGILNVMLQRLVSLSDDYGYNGVSIEPDLADEAVTAIEQLDYVEEPFQFMVWF